MISSSARERWVEVHQPIWSGLEELQPNPSETEVKEMKDGVRARIRMKDGKPVEGFRYYRGLPDALEK